MLNMDISIMPKIFESPDGGETVYERIAGETERTMIRENKSKWEQIQEDKLWGNIRRKAKTHPALQAELDRVIMLYHLLEEEHNG